MDANGARSMIRRRNVDEIRLDELISSLHVFLFHRAWCSRGPEFRFLSPFFLGSFLSLEGLSRCWMRRFDRTRRTSFFFFSFFARTQSSLTPSLLFHLLIIKTERSKESQIWDTVLLPGG
jgi:hypothetical protein